MNGDKNNPTTNNEMFYNPVKVDYNTIFYRNEYGGIDSDDKKGRKMIAELKLYRALYNFLWMLEQLTFTANKLENKLKDDNISYEQKKLYQEELNLINKYYRRVHKLFQESYDDK